MDRNIRVMTEADLPSVNYIETETFSDPWSEEDFRKSYEDPNNHYLVIEIDHRVVGYCGYWGVGDEGYIYNVAVQQEYRNQKLGYEMLSELIETGKFNGITSFSLEVRCSNEAAIRLYEKLGFVSEGIRKNFYTKPPEDAVIMWLRLIQ